VESGESARFEVRIPVALLRSGLAAADFVPPYAREAIDEALRRQGLGFRLEALTSANVDQMLARLDGLDWDGGQLRVRISAER
jgi:hypothetical protein